MELQDRTPERADESGSLVPDGIFADDRLSHRFRVP
jgi:hypothetical protein